MSVEAVAAELHMLPKIIEALESDDYAHLPSPVFVRGYLRNYARALNLPPEPLIDIYNRTTDAGDGAMASQIQENVGEERQLRWGLYLGVLGALVLMLVWGGSGRGLRFWESTPPAAESTAAVPERDSLPPGLALNDSTPAPKTGAHETTVPEALPAEPQNALPSENVAVAPPSVAEPPAATHVPANLASTPQTSPASGPAPQPAATSETGQGPDTLTVRLSGDSWVAIRDASGQRLVYGNLTAGTIRSIHGQAPFAVVIGNAPAAQIEFDGQRFEHGKYTKGLVARFKVTR